MSLQKETGINGAQNIIISLQHQNNISLQKAFTFALDMHNQELHKYLKLEILKENKVQKTILEM